MSSHASLACSGSETDSSSNYQRVRFGFEAGVIIPGIKAIGIRAVTITGATVLRNALGYPFRDCRAPPRRIPRGRMFLSDD